MLRAAAAGTVRPRHLLLVEEAAMPAAEAEAITRGGLIQLLP